MKSLFPKVASLLFILLPPFFFPGGAQAEFRLTGLADLEYTRFTETHASQIINLNGFQQKYELGFRTSGPIYDKGFADYALSTRYSTLQSATTNTASGGDEGMNINEHKLLIDARLNIHPADIPFRLNVFYSDLSPLLPISQPSSARSAMAPVLVKDIDVGGLRTYGFYFEYNGTKETLSETDALKYIQALKERNSKAESKAHSIEELEKAREAKNKEKGLAPPKTGIKLFIDYRSTEIDRKDIGERTEELKFSLNEGKNWLHYDRTRYDNLLGGGDYTEDGFQIGNVARDGRREWFYVSNWTLLSLDARFRRTDNSDIPRAIDSYNVNLFANAFRSTWDAYLYGSYSLTLNNEAYAGEYQLSLPLYIASKPAPEVTINNKFLYRQWEKWTMDRPRDPWAGEYFHGTPQEFEDWVAGKPIPGQTLEKKQEIVEDVILTHLNLPGRDLTFKPRLTIIKLSGMGDGDSTSNTLSYSIESSPARSYSYGLNYTFSRVRDDDGEDTSDDLTSHTFSVNGSYAITQRVGVSGSYTSEQAEDADRLPTADYRSDSIDLGANLYLHRTLSIDLRGTLRGTENGGDGYDEARTYTSNIRFTPASWLRITSSSSWIDVARKELTSEKSVNNPSISESTRKNTKSSYSTSNLMEIRVNRALSSRTRFDYSQEREWGHQGTVTTVSWPDEPPQTYTYSGPENRGRTVTKSIEEGFEYARMTNGYRARTLFNLTGSGNYSETKSDTASTNSKGVAMGINYYPSLYMSLGLSGSHAAGSDGSTRKGGSAYIAFPFPQLNFNASYGYEDSDGMNSYVAHKIALKLTKVF